MIGIRKRSLRGEFPQRVDWRLCVTESFHVTYGQVDVCKVRGMLEGGVYLLAKKSSVCSLVQNFTSPM